MINYPQGFDAAKRYRAVIVSHPGGGVKEQTAGTYARKLAEQGLVTVAFDRSYQGESTGSPRQLENPHVSTEDVSAVVDHLVTLPFIDGDRIGRFGLKAQAATLESITRGMLVNQMGITSDPFRGTAGTVSLAPGLAPQGTGTPNAPTRDTDPVQDPEISPADLGDLIAFTRFLAPPAPTPFDDAASRGEVEFEALGCAKCHIPELPSSRGPVRAYTDLLLHDMGPALADHINFAMPQLPQGGPTPQSPIDNGSEWRTQPLWGVSKFAPYLHDGRAETLDDAIRIHGGEGQAARDAYVALPADRREDVLAFLRHL